MITLVANLPGAQEWVQRQIPKVCAWLGQSKWLAALDQKGILLGTVVYDSFSPFDCCLRRERAFSTSRVADYG